MGKAMAEQFDELDDRVYALEFAFMALAKSLHQAKALDLLHLVGAMQDFSTQLRADAMRFRPRSAQDLTPVADQLDALRGFVWSLQAQLEE